MVLFRQLDLIEDTLKPTRGYLYINGSEKNDFSAKDYIRKAVNSLSNNMDSVEFIIGILWYDKEKPVAELFGMKETREWPGEPEIDFWVYSNGIYRQGTPNLCIGTLSLIEMEKAYRKKSKDRKSYIEIAPFYGESYF